MSVFLYVLFDPIDLKVRYVGQTRNPLPSRLSAHGAAARRGEEAPVASWFAGVVRAGRFPEIGLVNEVTEERAAEAEKVLIDEHVAEGADLLNVRHGPKPQGVRRVPAAPGSTKAVASRLRACAKELFPDAKL